MEFELKSCKMIVDQEKNLIRKVYYGSPSSHDILSHFEEFRNLPLPKNVRILEDYREATLSSIKTQELNDIADSIINDVECYSSVRMAFLHKHPNDQILSILVKEQTKHSLKFSSCVFTTHDAAIHWLLK